jgi:hypothetical protein
MAGSDQKLTFPTPLPSREGPGVGAPRSGGLRSIGQKLAALATHPNPSLEGRGYVLFPPISDLKGLVEPGTCPPQRTLKLYVPLTG